MYERVAKISFFKDKIFSNYSRRGSLMSLINITNKYYYNDTGVTSLFSGRVTVVVEYYSLSPPVTKKKKRK